LKGKPVRASFALLPLLICAAPALAQPAAAPAQAVQVPPQLTDPATADKLGRAMQSLSKAFLDLKVGEVQAALEGREATAAERKLTVRELERRKDPNFDRDFQRQIAQSKPMMEQSMKALQSALPAMMQGLAQAQQAIERAAANMPDPTYPKR
jgi:hypothetical protein